MFWYFVLKINPKQFSFVLLFLTFLIDFQLLCSLAVLVVLQQVLNDLNRFGRVQSKNEFYDEQFVLAAWSLQCLHFLEQLKLTFSSFGRFWPTFGFCAVWPYFLLLSKFDLRRFCTTLIKNQFSSKRGFCCVLATFVIKQFSLWHGFCEQTIWKHILFGLWSWKPFLSGFRLFTSFWHIFSFSCNLAVLLVFRPFFTDLKRFGSIFDWIHCFWLKEICFAVWLRQSLLSEF